jgi:hypothetical protein
MIVAVSLRLLYLLFLQVLRLVLLLGRPSSAKDIELLVLRRGSPSCAAPTPDHARIGQTGPCRRPIQRLP